MDNVPAWVLGILAVVAMVTVIIIGQVMPAIDAKSEVIITELNALDYAN